MKDCLQLLKRITLHQCKEYHDAINKLKQLFIYSFVNTAIANHQHILTKSDDFVNITVFVIIGIGIEYWLFEILDNRISVHT